VYISSEDESEDEIKRSASDLEEVDVQEAVGALIICRKLSLTNKRWLRPSRLLLALLLMRSYSRSLGQSLITGYGAIVNRRQTTLKSPY
jgi:hypothetical protein